MKSLAIGAVLSVLATLCQSRLVGMSYYTWFIPGRRNCQWGTPLVGNYDSDNRDVIRQHGYWLAQAGIDFVIIDWSNDIL